MGQAEPLYTVFSYIKYKFQAQGRHGVHSPFVYQLIEQCIIPASKSKDKAIEHRRKQLMQQNQIVELRNFKSGAVKKQRLGLVAKTSLSRGKFSAFLSQFLNYVNASGVLETGTSLGINSLYLAKSKTVNQVVTIEGNSEIAGVAKKTIADFEQSSKIKIIEGTLNDQFESQLDEFEFDVIFLDADHRSIAIENMVRLIRKKQKLIKAIIVHDIYWSADMKSCWDRLRAIPEIPISIDIFEAGILILNVETPKQHFVLKFS